MEITVDIDETDILSLNDHIITTVPSIRRRLLTAWILLTALFGLAAIVFHEISGPRSALPLAVASLIVFLGFYPYIRFCRRVNIRRLLRSGSNMSIFGPQTIEITPDEILRRNKHGHAACYWSSIDRVEVGTDHAFVFVSSMNAMLIPKRDLTVEIFEQFVELAEKYLRESSQRR